MHRLGELKVYQKALKLTNVVRSVTRGFPRDELFGLTAQFKRAVDSIVLNIAEGAGNSSNKEFMRFLGYSIRSGFECLGCSDIALENKFIDETIHTTTVSSVNEVIAMLYGLQKRLSK
ncbi:MAG: four helix bundle protein [Ignavibacteria bacterium]|nr:four helix bundle protein [Ignavibacteria bacterium]MBI3765672.1 four helix bundle protein [Ignavibacteriales bacterium]